MLTHLAFKQDPKGQICPHTNQRFRINRRSISQFADFKEFVHKDVNIGKVDTAETAEYCGNFSQHGGGECMTITLTNSKMPWRQKCTLVAMCLKIFSGLQTVNLGMLLCMDSTLKV